MSKEVLTDVNQLEELKKERLKAEIIKYKDILTKQEAASYMGICLSSFIKLQDRLPQIKIGKSIRFLKSDIEKFVLESCYERPAN